MPEAKPRGILKSIGPAIIVAAVVLGPGSILTSSRVGAEFGFLGLPVVFGAAILMIAMVALAARLGAVYDNSPCEELADRLGRPVAIIVGLILFLVVAFFQSSNNLAVIAGVEPLFEKEGQAATPISPILRIGILVAINLFVIFCLYGMRNLYGSIEKLMKLLIFLMVGAFLFNFVVVLISTRKFEPAPSGESPRDWISLIGMIGTTFSVGGAFYQAYLVKEKGWGINDVRRGLIDSIASISVLGLITAVILSTSVLVFHGNPDAPKLGSVADVARQLEPLFGTSAKVIFCIGIFAGAFSSFMVNALIGGTILSDSIGRGSRLEDRWPLHLTTLALLVGMGIAIMQLLKEGSTVDLITFAQALTVLGLPALALTLVYLGTRKELTGARKIPTPILALSVLGLLVACGLAALTVKKLADKFQKESQAAKTAWVAPPSAGD